MSKGHQEAMDYIYDRALDEDEVRCGKCRRKVNLYNEEVYHEGLNDEERDLEWVCRECVA